MKILTIIMSILACSTHPPKVKAEEQPGTPPCHRPLKIVDTGSELHLIANCDPDQKTVIDKADLKGKDGRDGRDGTNGERGPAGPRGPTGSSADETITICAHGGDHIDRTKKIKLSKLVKERWGLAGEYDHPGRCEYEGQCTCDQCGRPVEESLFKHRHVGE